MNAERHVPIVQSASERRRSGPPNPDESGLSGEPVADALAWVIRGVLIVGHHCVGSLASQRLLVLGRVPPNGQRLVLGVQRWDMSTPRSSGQ